MSERPRPEVDGADPAARAEALVRRGLEHYGRGELLAAIGEWEGALALQPEHRRARQYYDYVVEHFDVLAERFREVRESRNAELDVPFGVENLDHAEESDGDYAEVEVSSTGDEPLVAELAAGASVYVESVDEGWALQDEADMLPPAPGGATGGAPVINAGPVLDLGAEIEAEGLIEAEEALPAAPAPRADTLPDPRGFEDNLGTRDTLELSARPAIKAPTRAVGSQPGVRGDEETSPGPKVPGIRAPDDEITTPGGEEPAPYERGLALSDDAIRAIRPKFPEGLSPEETTAERGSLARGFALPNLDDLDIEVRRDDRRQGDSDPEVTVRFRADSESGTSPGRFDEEQTAERRTGRELEEEQTAERRSSRELEEEMTVERGGRSSGGSAAVIVDQSLLGDDLGTGELPARGRRGEEPLEGTGAVAFATMCTLILRELDQAVAIDTDEPEAERVRRRVSSLIDRAERERESRRLGAAVAALDLALEEEPESATAQKLIHRSRDGFCAIYEQFIGDLGQVPTLALPMHDLPSQDLDSRAVFLLSRIDGTFTFDEIVDVSGMSRLEALRHLAKLVLLGVLEVR